MGDAPQFDLLQAELAALVAELGDEIPLEEPHSLIEVARIVASDPALSRAWEVKGDVYSAVEALSEVIDRRWRERPMPWHLARICLWFDSTRDRYPISALQGPSDEGGKWLDISQVYQLSHEKRDGRSKLSARVEAARLLLERCPHDGFALEGLHFSRDDLDEAHYANMMAHLAAHQASPEAQDFMTLNLSYLGSGYRSSKIREQFFVAERAHHLVRRILAEETVWSPSNEAIARLYDTIGSEARAGLLAAMAPGLGGHPAADRMKRIARPDLLMAALLRDPKWAESAVGLAEQWSGVRALAAASSRETLESLAKAAPDVARRAFARMPALLAPALADDAKANEVEAVRAALVGAEDLIGPVERSGLELFHRLRALSWIDRPAGLDATLRVLGALFGAPDSLTDERRKALTELIDTVTWISTDHWLRLAMSWPACLSAAENSKRFRTALRFSASQRIELRAAIDIERTLQVRDILAMDQPPPPPSEHEARLGGVVMNCLRLGTDEAVARAVDVLARGTVAAPQWYYHLDIPAEAMLRALALLRSTGHEPGQEWWTWGLRAACALTQDALHVFFEATLAAPLWSAMMAMVQSQHDHEHVDVRYILPWSAAALIEAGEDPGEIIRWMLAMHSSPRLGGGRTESTYSAVFQLLARLQTAFRVSAMLGLLEDASVYDSLRYEDMYGDGAKAWMVEALHGRDPVLLLPATYTRPRQWTAEMIDGPALHRLCRRWYLHEERKPLDYYHERRLEDPSAAFLAGDLPTYSDGLLGELAPRWRWSQPHGAFPRRVIEAAANAPGDTLARCLDGMTRSWLTSGRLVWSTAGDPCHWSADHAPRSVLAHAVEALCNLEGEQAVRAVNVWLPTMGAVVPDGGAAPPGLVIGLLNAIARLAPPGSPVPAAAVESADALGAIDGLAVHRRLADAIGKSSGEPRPAGRRLREARQALIRAERRVRGCDGAE